MSKRRVKVITRFNNNYVIEIGGKVNEITIEALAAALAAMEQIATNHDALLKGKYGTSADDVLTACQYARKAWFDLNGEKVRK